MAKGRPTVAAIIPTLNEAGRIGALLDSPALVGFDEIIVVDGGSTDSTEAEVRGRPGVGWISAPRGRGPQLNAGVAACKADLIFLLHADTCPPWEVAALIRRTLQDADVSGGCFRLSFDRQSRLLGLYAWASRWETPFTTFGDQGIFMRRPDYDRIGGLPDWPFLEDVELRRRLKRIGRFVKLREAMTTSARRFANEGELRRQALNLVVLTLFWLGLSPHTLIRLYRAHSGAQQRCRRGDGESAP